MEMLASAPSRSIPIVAINFFAVAVLVAWLVAAIYALAYLVSR
jgi:hypothetical protein